MKFADNAKGYFPNYEGKSNVMLDLVLLEDMRTEDEFF